MNILLIGGRSALAKITTPVLQSFAKVVSLGRSECDISMDIRDVDVGLLRSNKIDVIVNMAAYFSDNTFRDISQSYDVNVTAVLNVAQACAQSGNIHFVNISSIFSLLKSSSTYYGVYAMSKKHSDELLQFACRKFDVPLTILQPSQLYGHEGFRKHQPFFYHVIDKVRTGQDIYIYGKHDALRNYIHAGDVADVIASVIQQKVTGCFPCMYPEDVSLSQISKAAIAAFDSESQVKFLHEKADIPDNIFEKDLTVFEKTQCYPKIDMNTGLNMMFEEYKAKQ